jgi:hypothetical protein
MMRFDNVFHLHILGSEIIVCHESNDLIFDIFHGFYKIIFKN